MARVKSEIPKHFAWMRQQFNTSQMAEKSKAIHAMYTGFVRGFQPYFGKMIEQRKQMFAASAAAAAAPPPPALSSDNLRKLEAQVAKQQQGSAAVAQKFVTPTTHVASPDGSPLTFRASLKPEDLRLPTKRKRNNTITEGAPGAKRSPTSTPTPAPTHICGRDGCTKTFDSDLALSEHHQWHEKEIQRKQEEDARKQHRNADPLGYAISSIASFFNLDADGNPIPDPTTNIKTEPPATSTPQPTLTTSTPKLPQTPTTKPQEPKPKSHLPSPPTTVWDLHGAPLAMRHCVEGLQTLSGLQNMDSALFTPAYTPEESGSEDSDAAAIASYDEFDPWGFKEVAGGELLQDMDWDMVAHSPTESEGLLEVMGFLMVTDK
ncbi:hypothetical protein EX30DRAFT_116880 [Ascodesmis nigricans]|uniref:C2H2-type domain-containing protein n=1 Tax=Ascodesmis nigricans TaxID=341454 RepID=A0A4S2MPL7_9PEZI|nr:hypothetical protein EX30DRAFT_116880 [Ascodesmis nigricans]